MSDIPVGRPPAPPGRHAAPAGWYPDPLDGRRTRYWDGWQWSRETRESETGPGHAGPSGGQAGQQPYPSSGREQWLQPGAGQPGTPYSGASGKEIMTADGRLLASWWARFGAWLLDMVIIQLLSIPLALPAWQRIIAQIGDYWEISLAAAEQGLPAPPTPDPQTLISTTDQLWISFSVIVSALIVHLMFLIWKGATPGQLAVGIQPVQTDGQPKLSTRSIMARTLFRGIAPQIGWLLLLAIADGLVAAFSPTRQSLHDRLSSTQVVRRR